MSKFTEDDIRWRLDRMDESTFNAHLDDLKRLVSVSYHNGKNDAINDFEIDDLTQEKIGVEYAAEAFKECQTLEDFQDKLREINNRVCNFMPIIG